MHKFLLTTSKPIMRHKWLYYLLNFTWGLPMTLVGLIALLFLLPMHPKRFCNCICVRTKGSWGGLSLGIVAIRDTISTELITCHEYGHTFQNAIFGPFMPFVVTIPSAIRYWHRYFKYERKGIMPVTDYDAIWFEGTATELGFIAAKK